jgi:hypothetical protein
MSATAVAELVTNPLLLVTVRVAAGVVPPCVVVTVAVEGVSVKFGTTTVTAAEFEVTELA